MLTEMTKDKQSSPLLILIYVVLNFVKAYMFSLDLGEPVLVLAICPGGPVVKFFNF
jgi:hypothetical protein